MLIGITGHAGAGKDTAASYLVSRWGYQPMAFADPLRAMMRAGLGLTDLDFRPERKTRLIPHIGASYRKIAQTLGTEWGRNCIDPDLWVNLMAQRLDQCLQLDIPVVITDVRFENEAQMIRSRGGSILRLFRPQLKTDDSHVSESGIKLGPGDLDIHNGGEFTDLYRSLDLLVEALRSSPDA